MGKKLIIKGADFSENGIPYSEEFSLLFGINVAGATTAGATVLVDTRQFLLPSFALNAMAGKTIYGIKLKVYKAGTFGICKIKGLTADPIQGDSIPSSVTIADVTTVTALGTGVRDLFFDEPITLDNDEILGIKYLNLNTSNYGIVYYGPGANFPQKVSINNGSNTYNSVSTSTSQYNWGIDFFVAAE